MVGWLVVLGLMALLDSISVYIRPSPRERENDKSNGRREIKCPNNPIGRFGIPQREIGISNKNIPYFGS